MSVEKIRVVIDTQVFLRAALNLRSLPAKVVFDLSGQYQLIVSEEIVAEVRDVLYRPKLRAKFPHLTDKVAEKIFQLLADTEKTTLNEIVEVSRDPKDDMFLACAEAAHANYIVSEDKDLLDLGSYGNTQIINVFEFSRILQPSSQANESESASGDNL